MNYNKKVMEHFMNPKNMGEMKNSDGVGRVGNPTCGDIMEVQIKVGNKGKKNEFIKDIKFKTFGCAAAIASSSMITQLAKKKKLDDVEKLKWDDVVKELGGLPCSKKHCSALGVKALRMAVEDYKKKK